MNYGYELWIIQRTTEQGTRYLTWDGWGRDYWVSDKSRAGVGSEHGMKEEAAIYKDPAVTAVRKDEA